jgi:hypothetical protein
MAILIFSILMLAIHETDAVVVFPVHCAGLLGRHDV